MTVDTIIAYMPFIWIGIAIIFAIVEGATMGLVTIWFTIGAGAASVVAVLDGSLFIQISVFIAVSIILLIFTRPLLRQKLKVGKEKNNVDQYIGEIGVVIEEIKPFRQGRVKLKSLDWAAVGENSEVGITEGKEVKVVRIEGVKAIVNPLD